MFDIRATGSALNIHTVHIVQMFRVSVLLINSKTIEIYIYVEVDRVYCYCTPMSL